MSAGALYSLWRQRHRSDEPVRNRPNGGSVWREAERVLSPGCTRARRFTLLFVNEFRFLVLTMLVMLAALTLQHSVEDALRFYMNTHIRKPQARLVFLFGVAVLAVVVVIVLTLVWPPKAIPEPEA